jgi:hypothetical protein
MPNQIPFQPTVLNDNESSSRSVTGLLAKVHQTDTIKRFFAASVNHLFRPGAGKQMNGYVGQQPPYYDPSSDVYITEPTTSRQFYQLEPTMVSKDSNNEITHLLSYPDIVNQLRFQGAHVGNHDRLFEQNYYTWCPPIDLEKLINFREYYWVETDDMVPDYLVIEQGAANKNPWSANNLWFHKDDLTDEQKAGTLSRAIRPIVEFKKELELYNYGSWRRLDVYVCADNVNFGSMIAVANTQSNPVVEIDGVTITSATGAVRVLVVNDQDYSLTDRVFTLTFVQGQIHVSTETDGLEATGAPVTGELITVENGLNYQNKELYYTGAGWTACQQKTDINIAPLFNLYDTNGLRLDDPITYPASTFSGNAIFTYDRDTTGTIPDSVLNIVLTYDENGQINFKNHIATNRVYFTDAKNIQQEIVGFYFHKSSYDDGTTSLSNDWYRVSGPTRQMCVDRYVCDGVTSLFAICQTPDVDVVGEPSNIRVERIRQSEDTTYPTNYSVLTPVTDYLLVEDTIFVANVQQGDILTIKTYSKKGRKQDTTGFYEVPMNLQANPNNEQINVISSGDYFDQFSGIMSGQDGFTGKPYSRNNWRNTAKDPSKGRNIVQHDAGLLTLALTLRDSNLDYMNAVRFAEAEYIRFKNKFEQKDYRLF